MSNVEGEKSDFDDLDLPGAGPELTAESPIEPPEDLAGDEIQLAPTEELPEEPAGKREKQAKKAAKARGPRQRRERPEREGPGLLERLTQTSPYVVLLGIALVAIMIALVCLILEWKRYDFTTRPAQAAAPPAVSSAPAGAAVVA